MNVAAQNTIDEFGRIIAKDRLTHDQSFDFSEKSSVNSRVIWDDLPPVRYMVNASKGSLTTLWQQEGNILVRESWYQK
jgi:hypothetical protein